MTALARVLCAFVAFFAALALAACVPNAGADDVELTYELDAPAAVDPANGGFGEDLRALVLRRLAAGHVSADVVEDDRRRLRIVVDELWAPAVDELLTWTGTIHLYEVDARSETMLEGTRQEVRRAVETTTPPTDARLLLEPRWDSGPELPPRRWRTRLVRAPAIGELADGTLVGWGQGGTLRLRVTKDSPAASVLASARALGGGREIVAVRGKTSLGKVAIDGDAVVLSFGPGFESYARAQQEMQLLTTPRLPRLRRAGAVGLPPNDLMLASCVIVPVLLSLAWLAFIRRFDRAHPEPIWLVLVTFLLGAVATIPAAFAEYALARISPILDPRLASFGGRAFALPLAFVVFTAVVGVVEEGAKLAAAAFAARRREFDEPVDGIVYGIVASLGFAAAENFQFFATGRLAVPLVVARAFMSIPAHMFFGSIWGYALGARLVDRRRRLALWFLLAAAMHGLFDALLSTEGAGTLAVALNVSLASVFVVLVRRALRHGVVEEAARAVKPEERLLFRVGRPSLFWASAITLHVLAFAIFMLGAWYQLARHRASLGFVIASTLLVLLLAVAAFGVSAALPLDVAVDSYGVTFAGAARPWRKIRGIALHSDHIELDCEGGPIVLGPGPRPVVEAIASAIRVHLGGGSAAERAITLESRPH